MKAVAAFLDGIVLGLQYGLLGVGLTLIYGLAGVVNLAHGQVAILGAIIVSLLMGAGWAAVPAVVVGVLAAGVILLVLDLTLMRCGVPRARRTPHPARAAPDARRRIRHRRVS